MVRENYSSYAPKHGHLSTTTTLHGKYEHGIYTHPAGKHRRSKVFDFL
jgi:hypothetical protein